MATSCGVDEAAYDRLAEVKAFDETRAGVKGLLDAGLTSVPRLFLSPPDVLATIRRHPDPTAAQQIPIVNLSDIAEGEQRREAVEQIRRASESWGFFQIVGHGVPLNVLDEMIAGTRRFHEGDTGEKAQFYSRDPGAKVGFSSTFNLYGSRVADWRDSLHVCTAPDAARPDEIPQTCKEIVPEYTSHMRRVGEMLLELLSEALGLRPSYLKDMECDKGHLLVLHYYPTCPEPELTLGGTRHSDAGFITILLQDDIGGLQVLHQGQWVDVRPVRGALVINIGDLMQLISNGRFKSVEHRVLANKHSTPRISSVFLFNTLRSTKVYGPIKELLTEDNPPKYSETSLIDYNINYFSGELNL